jgi:hypothetical protein
VRRWIGCCGGDLPRGGKCDVKSLAVEAGVTRAALYSTYQHLKQEFERRRGQLRESGAITDPRERQIERQKVEVAALRERLAKRDVEISELTKFRTTAVSRLAAQHDEITRLRAVLASRDNVHGLRPGHD